MYLFSKAKVAEMRMLNSTCQDLPPDDNWRKFWTLYPTVLSSFYGRDISGTTFYAEIIQTVNAMISGGCPVLAQSPFELMTQASWCQGMSTLFRPLQCARKHVAAILPPESFQAIVPPAAQGLATARLREDACATGSEGHRCVSRRQPANAVLLP